MQKLPVDVLKVKEILLRDPSNNLYAIAQKLVVDSPELVGMWQTLEKKNKYNDDLWVRAFLQTAQDATALPPYHFKSVSDRKEISEEIEKLASRLVQALRANELDGHIFRNDGNIFNGFYLYEDFGESNRSRIDRDGIEKLNVTLIIEQIANRAMQKINNEPMQGKVGANVRAVRFARIVAARNIRLYEEPLNTVVATATNELFGTFYGAGDISNLLNR